MATVTLVPFTECEPAIYGPMLAGIVWRSRPRLERDFPTVLKRYATPQTAARAVRQGAALMNEGESLAAFAVSVDDEVYGLATLQLKLLPKRIAGALGCGKVVDGPLFAAWLDPHRPATAKGVGLLLLDALANELLLRAAKFPGTPWTLVRPDHARAIELLKRTTAFGGCTLIHEASKWSRVDGAGSIPREVYAGNLSTAQLVEAK